MLAELARFAESLFPSIDPQQARRLLDALEETDTSVAGRSRTSGELYAATLPDAPCQGDILEPFTFYDELEDGTFEARDAAGMILSHSCDFDQDEFVVIAECQPFRLLRNTRVAPNARKNRVTSLFYLPYVPAKREDYFVDFTRVQSVNRAALHRKIDDGYIIRVASLSSLGYYAFVLKLSMHYLRPPPREDVRGDPVALGFFARAHELARRIPTNLRYLFAR
ncbi:MAG: hypothetical protein ACJ79K_05040 [Gemmatimonadaceae bacterium]